MKHITARPQLLDQSGPMARSEHSQRSHTCDWRARMVFSPSPCYPCKGGRLHPWQYTAILHVPESVHFALLSTFLDVEPLLPHLGQLVQQLSRAMGAKFLPSSA
jgi:hypothetical protein